MPLPDTRQVLAGIWIRLRILAPILLPLLAALWMFGVLPSASARTFGALIVLIILALDAVRHPGGTRR